MGEVELDITNKRIVISSHIILYGNSADELLAQQLGEEIEAAWNEPAGKVRINNLLMQVQFIISAAVKERLTDVELYQNVNPRNNYFRIEEFAYGNISFVDGLGCNTGYFKLENLYRGSTTAAHEYGHTLGLDHPIHLDIRGSGVPGIMYPRGTLVDPPFQYDPTKPAGVTGGTMHPMYRKVSQEDITNLELHRLSFRNNRATVGQFTNIYHWNHAEDTGEDFMEPPIIG